MKPVQPKKILKYSLMGLFLFLIMGCLGFLFVNVNRPILGRPVETPVVQAEDIQQWESQAISRLRKAPWQGLRYLSEKNEWRFYALAGETKQIDLMVPFDLIQVYYLEADGDLDFTWVNIGLTIPGQDYFSTTSDDIQAGDLVEVVLTGDYVTRSGVRWDLCKSEYCGLAEMIDTIIILDDQGTGITNGFIRYGWEPPTYPTYGFLCWDIRQAGEEVTVNEISREGSK
jgi:hypothetical protein